MPYRIDVENPPDDAFDCLVDVGALDVDRVGRALAAILPDSVSPQTIAAALGRAIRVGPARSRDGESVWVLRPRALRAGRLQIVPADHPAERGALRLIDGPAFGTGLHPTTELCLTALHNEVQAGPPASMLDVGAGSGILALAALRLGVPRVVAIDIDAEAVRATDENARLNGLRRRLGIVQGGIEALSGRWPLVVANVLAAPLMMMAPALARCVEHRGRVVLSGLRSSLVSDVEHAYRRVGMRPVGSQSRDGWSALTLNASW